MYLGAPESLLCLSTYRVFLEVLKMGAESFEYWVTKALETKRGRFWQAGTSLWEKQGVFSLSECRKEGWKMAGSGRKPMMFQSTISRIVTVIIALVLPINIMTLVLSNMVLQKNKEQISGEIQNTLEHSMDSLGDTLKRVTRKQIYLSFDDAEFRELSNRVLDTNQKGLLLHNVKEKLESAQVDYPWVDTMFFHFPANRLLIMTGYPGVSTQETRKKIEEAIEKEQYKELAWESMDIQGTAVLFGFSNWQNTDFGVMLNLERTLDKLNLSDHKAGRTVFFMNQEGTVLTRKGREYLEEKGKTLEALAESGSCQVFSVDLPGYDLKLVEAVEWNKLNENLSATIILVQVLSVLMTLLVIPLLLWYVRKWISRPLNRLVGAIDKIEGGDLEYRIATDGASQGREFEQINRSFNDMMEQVKYLKIDVYEKELERKNIRMRYLNQQIQPHFILNAMNILYSYEPEEYPLIQKMILCISKYFRYIVKVNAKFVELGQEMEHIQNYFEIQKARYPGLFFSIVEYEESLKKALIPPLLVQNFAENAIKHSLKIGNKITIFVITDYCREEGKEDRMRIRLADTGAGMSDELLEKIEVFRQAGIHQEGLGVGIENSIERLKFLYPEETSIRFWRDEHYSGTNVEIILPVHFAQGGWEHADIVD